VINPTVIIEVLSDSTKAFDGGEKFLRYQNWNPSLTDYILVSQFAVIVEHYVRQPDASWYYQVYQGPDQSLVVKSIDCRLQLSEVYDRIVFPSDPRAEEQ
jgi:Uma2 family endonuclease